jgi:hypothetical protein
MEGFPTWHVAIASNRVGREHRGHPRGRDRLQAAIPGYIKPGRRYRRDDRDLGADPSHDWSAPTAVKTVAIEPAVSSGLHKKPPISPWRPHRRR